MHSAPQPYAGWALEARPPTTLLSAFGNQSKGATNGRGQVASLFSIKPAAGLRSVARNNKATRLLTRPGWTTKSSAKDSILRVVKLQYASEPPLFSQRRPVLACSGAGPKAYSYPTTTCRKDAPRSGMDSDLEAFSHNPADGSFAAMPGQTAAKTNYLNPRFLSY